MTVDKERQHSLLANRQVCVFSRGQPKQHSQVKSGGFLRFDKQLLMQATRGQQEDLVALLTVPCIVFVDGRGGWEVDHHFPGRHEALAAVQQLIRMLAVELDVEERVWVWELDTHLGVVLGGWGGGWMSANG